MGAPPVRQPATWRAGRYHCLLKDLKHIGRSATPFGFFKAGQSFAPSARFGRSRSGRPGPIPAPQLLAAVAQSARPRAADLTSAVGRVPVTVNCHRDLPIANAVPARASPKQWSVYSPSVLLSAPPASRRGWWLNAHVRLHDWLGGRVRRRRPNGCPPSHRADRGLAFAVTFVGAATVRWGGALTRRLVFAWLASGWLGAGTGRRACGRGLAPVGFAGVAGSAAARRRRSDCG